MPDLAGELATDVGSGAIRASCTGGGCTAAAAAAAVSCGSAASAVAAAAACCCCWPAAAAAAPACCCRCSHAIAAAAACRCAAAAAVGSAGATSFGDKVIAGAAGACVIPCAKPITAAGMPRMSACIAPCETWTDLSCSCIASRCISACANFSAAAVSFTLDSFSSTPSASTCSRCSTSASENVFSCSVRALLAPPPLPSVDLTLLPWRRLYTASASMPSRLMVTKQHCPPAPVTSMA